MTRQLIPDRVKAEAPTLRIKYGLKSLCVARVIDGRT
jgi:hypothetical protein